MRLNRVLYFGDLYLCPGAVLGLAALTMVGCDMVAIGRWAAAFLAGGALWTFIEYAVHRWVYHRLGFFETMHDAHHAEPTGLIAAPSFVIVPLVFLVSYLPAFFVDRDVAGGFTSGLLVGYFFDMLVHHASHHWTLRRGSWLYRLRLRHMAHHFENVKGNYGVITAFWDRQLSTYIKPSRRRVS